MRSVNRIRCNLLLVPATALFAMIGPALVHAELIHHWTLDEDISGGATTAADIGSVPVPGAIGDMVTSVMGVNGGAFSFNGDVNSNVNLSAFSATGLEQLTASLWLKSPQSFTTSTAGGGFIRVLSANDAFEIVINAGAGGGAPAGSFGNNFYIAGGTYARSTEPVPDDEWVFVTMTGDVNTGVHEIYINGIFDATLTGTPTPYTESGIRLGARNNTGNTKRFEGQLDDVRFYDTIFTEAEVLALYESYQFGPSDELFTWGARTPTGSWSSTTGWQSNNVDTADHPEIGAEDADEVQVLSGTVSVDTADQGAWSLQIDNGGAVNVAATRTLEILEEVTIDAGGSLLLGGTLTTPRIDAQGSVTFSDGVLAVGSGSIASVATTSGQATIQNAAELSVGQLTLAAGESLVKQNEGALILDQSGGANSLAAGSSVNVEAGTVAAVNDATNNALGSATVNLSGGDLTLSSKQPSATAFDAPIAVTSTRTILAAQQGSGAIAGETVTLGGVHGVAISAGAEATFQTADDYTLNLAGNVTGDGKASFGSGAKVNVNAALTTAVVEFQGDVSGVTGVANVAPGQAYGFAPTQDTPSMSIGFDVGGAVDVIVDGQVDGSVSFEGATTYTGTTRIVRGALRVGASSSSPAGDYNDSGLVEQGDLDLVLLNWGGSWPPPVPGWINGQPTDGTIDQNDLDGVLLNWGNAGNGSGLPTSSLLQFEGASPGVLAVLESAAATFARNIGTGAGEVNWAGSGGFASTGGTGGLDVTLEGGADLTWSSATAGFNGNALQLGSPFADGLVKITNNLNLENAERIVQIANNPNSDDDSAEISGVISSTGSEGVLTVTSAGGGSFSNGLLVLSANNSMSKLRIADAAVDAAQGAGLPATANLEFAGNDGNRQAVWAGSGALNRNIGPGDGEVAWTGPGGFAARGGPLTVALEGGATLAWEDANAGFAGNSLQLGSSYGDNIVTFTNNVTGFDATPAPANRVIETFDNPLSDADGIVISGNFVQGFNDFSIEGSARVVFDGDITLDTTAGADPDLNIRNTATLILNGVVAMADLVPRNSSNVFVNNTVSVTDDVIPQNTASFGGDGTITLLNTSGNAIARLQGGQTLRPGADVETVGTLDFVLTDATPMRLANNSNYEMDFESNGGLQHDSVDLAGTNSELEFLAPLELGTNTDNTWNLELNALNDLTGLVNAGGEFDLFTFNKAVLLKINGTEFFEAGSGFVDNVVFASTDFDTSTATVQWVIESDFSGRVFVTGLGLAAASAAVPEPASATLAALAALAILSLRRRKVA